MMDEVTEAIRLNPNAAKELDEAKDVLEMLRELRERGLVGGEEFQPLKGRHTLKDLKPKGIVKGNFKLTFRA